MCYEGIYLPQVLNANCRMKERVGDWPYYFSHFRMDQTPVVAANKKIVIIVTAALALLLILAWFSGIFGGGIGVPAAVSGVDVDRNMDGSTTYTNEQGSVTVGQGASMPSNWPSDAPTAYQGASIVYSGTTNPTTGEVGSAAVYTVSASLADVMRYYTAKLSAEGWTVESNAEMAGMRVITARKDTRLFAAYMQEVEGKVSVTTGVQF